MAAGARRACGGKEGEQELEFVGWWDQILLAQRKGGHGNQLVDGSGLVAKKKGLKNLSV